MKKILLWICSVILVGVFVVLIINYVGNKQVQQPSSVEVLSGEAREVMTGEQLPEYPQLTDYTEFVGTEHLATCEFGCKLGYESRDFSGVVSRDIYRFTSLDLGITLLYEASWTTKDGTTSPQQTIIQNGNFVCLVNRDNLQEIGAKVGCIEFLPYEEWEKIAKEWYKVETADVEVFFTGNIVGYIQPNGYLIVDGTTNGEPYYDMNARRKHLPDTNIYFVQYNCEGCAPGADLTWVDTIEPL